MNGYHTSIKNVIFSNLTLLKISIIVIKLIQLSDDVKPKPIGIDSDYTLTRNLPFCSSSVLLFSQNL